MPPNIKYGQNVKYGQQANDIHRAAGEATR